MKVFISDFISRLRSRSSQKQNLQGEGSRYPTLDAIRGFAVLLMIIFHFSFDLKIFGYAQIDFQNDIFWWAFPRVIVFLFLIAVGQALELTSISGIKKEKVLKRFLKLAVLAGLISLFTFFAFPGRWIYFGTLHCIATCSLLALPFVGKPKLAFAFSLIILLPLLGGFQWPWWRMEHASMDYIPALPWLGVVLLGQMSFHYKVHAFDIPRFPGRDLLLFFGQHSLFIYLLHQPLLFGLVKLFYTLAPPSAR